MSKKRSHSSNNADDRGEAPTDDVEAAIVAGGEVVGTTADDQPLVEGPNSK
jgi:hypothetical protein